MIFTVKWSPRSEIELIHLLDYLLANWGLEKVNETDKAIKELVKQICEMPGMFPTARSKNKTRYAVLTKHTTIYYRVRKKEIEIISLFDTRQNPNKLRL